MITLIIGGSGSGKSAYAEQQAIHLAASGNAEKYYLATMAVHDEEMRRKVERHQRLRAGDGWITLEFPRQAAKAASFIVPGAVVLLEDLGNLTANEMFAAAAQTEAPANHNAGNAGRERERPERKDFAKEEQEDVTEGTMAKDADYSCMSAQKISTRIMADLHQLEKVTSHLLIVSNLVFSDGITYDASTQEYIRALGLLHQQIAAAGAHVIEIVLGIPIVLQ